MANFGEWQKKIREVMKKEGFHLVREKKHMIWKDKRGNIVTTSKTPRGNIRVCLNNLKATIRRVRMKRVS